MRLRELRIKNGLTQNEIASKLGVSGQTILNWENKIYEPKISQLIELADLFGVSVDYLVERKSMPNRIEDLCKELEKYIQRRTNNLHKKQFIKQKLILL